MWTLGLTAVLAGGGLCAWAALHPASQLFGPTVRHTERTSTLALTFDDGPNPSVTPGLLELLGKNNVSATFFLIGRHVRACPGLTQEISARGHSLGNHTDTHPSLICLSRNRITEELLRCQEAIEESTGRRPVLMRPPYGHRAPQLEGAVRQAGLTAVVTWSASACDWKPQPATRVIARLGGVHDRAIVLLHDGDPVRLGGDRQHTIRALEFWLPRWKEIGFQFVTLEGGVRR